MDISPSKIVYIFTYMIFYRLLQENKMPKTYKVKRRLQEQSGSYFVILPKIWVKSLHLKQGDLLNVNFNGSVTISPPKLEKEVK